MAVALSSSQLVPLNLVATLLKKSYRWPPVCNLNSIRLRFDSVMPLHGLTINGTSPMNDYFIKRGKSVRGPFSLKKIQQLLSEGKLKRIDLVGRREDGPWRTVAAVRKKIQAGESPSGSLVGAAKKQKNPKKKAASVYRVKEPLFGQSLKVIYPCHQCGTELVNPLAGAGQLDNCPVCGSEHRVPGTLEKSVQRELNEHTPPQVDGFAEAAVELGLKVAKTLGEWIFTLLCLPFSIFMSAKGFLVAIIFAMLGFFFYQIEAFSMLASLVEEGGAFHGYSWAGLFFLAGVVFFSLPIAALMSMSPIVLLLVVIADNTSSDGGIGEFVTAAAGVCMVIGVVLMILSVPIGIVEWLI